MNRLAHESSPYLLQHAGDPVDWWPWSPHALAMAARQDKPVFLSIGYSASHACQSMGRACFADPVQAELLNRHFVSILVDRDERPDLDRVYQCACLLLGHSECGWPLSVFLTPAGIPFHVGTYFPPTPLLAHPGFAETLQKLTHAWRHQRPQIETQAQALLGQLRHRLQHPEADTADFPAQQTVAREIANLLSRHDALHGGFGDAPKFAHCAELQLLLRAARLPEGREAGQVALDSLRRMAASGLYDQLGGGFFRYCCDHRWERPHFEKTLADNAQLLWLYAEAWALTGEDDFARVVHETIAWLERDLQADDGAFHTALAADGEGREGASYLWQRAEVDQLLDGEHHLLILAHFGLDQPPLGECGAWHLRVVRPLGEVAQLLALPEQTARQLLDTARTRLLEARRQRPAPARDATLRCAPNALLIRGLARAAGVFGRADWQALAQHTLAAVRSRFIREQRLLACASQTAFLDDHAFLLDACLELLRLDYRPADMALACWLGDQLLARFGEPGGTGLYFSALDHETLIARPRPIHDHGTPSGNGVAASALLRLGWLTGERRYLVMAQSCMRLIHPHPGGQARLVQALDEWLQPQAIVILHGEASSIAPWQRTLLARNSSELYSLAIPTGTQPLPQALDKPAHGSAQAWLSRAEQTQPPIDRLDQLLNTIPRGSS